MCGFSEASFTRNLCFLWRYADNRRCASHLVEFLKKLSFGSQKDPDGIAITLKRSSSMLIGEITLDSAPALRNTEGLPTTNK